jgi:hypothetical protein
MENSNGEKEVRFREIVIPGDILADRDLSDGAKLMYGKIARLSFKTGECWASNSFLDGTESGRNASRLIAELKKYGYITIRDVKSKNRKINICPVNSRLQAGSEDGNPANPGDVPEAVKTATPPNLAGSEDGSLAYSGDVSEASNTQHRQFRRGNHANSGDVSSPNLATEQINLTNLNNTTATPVPEEPDKPEDAEAAAVEIFKKAIKETLKTTDRRLFFDSGFYDRAAAFMLRKGLDIGYLSWLHEKCEAVKPSSFNGLYYKLFFLEHLAEGYLSEKAESVKAPPRPYKSCPICGKACFENDLKCGDCGLPVPWSASDTDIANYKKLLDLPPEKRDEFFRKENVILSDIGDLINTRDRLNALRTEFGLLAS